MNNIQLSDFIERYEINSNLMINELSKYLKPNKPGESKIKISDPDNYLYDCVQKTIYLLKELTESNPALDMISRIDQAENDLFAAVQKISSLKIQLQIAEEMMEKNKIQFTTD